MSINYEERQIALKCIRLLEQSIGVAIPDSGPEIEVATFVAHQYMLCDGKTLRPRVVDKYVVNITNKNVTITYFENGAEFSCNFDDMLIHAAEEINTFKNKKYQWDNIGSFSIYGTPLVCSTYELYSMLNLYLHKIEEND